MAPTSVAIVESAVAAWNREDLTGALARELDGFATRPLELTDYRSVGEKVVACDGDSTLVFTVVKSNITGLIVYESGDKVPERLRAPD